MKKAFTILELVFIIVIIGILATVIIPKTETDSLQQAATQVISDIRYTQHLAMVDDKYDANNSEWFKGKWQFLFGESNNTNKLYAYTIFSDKSTYSGNPDPKEMATNPLDKSKLLSGGFSGTLNWEDAKASKTLNIGYSYGITNVRQSGCGAKRISFDYLGRPFKGNNKSWTSSIDGLLKKSCKFTLYQNDNTITIQINPETGYACILNNAGTACQ